MVNRVRRRVKLNCWRLRITESTFAHWFMYYWCVLEKSRKLMFVSTLILDRMRLVYLWGHGVKRFCAPVRKDARAKMCSRRKIIWSLLVLSVLEIGLGVSSIALGTVGICLVKGEHKTQQGDASPVWSGVCVRLAFLFCCLLQHKQLIRNNTLKHWTFVQYFF